MVDARNFSESNSSATFIGIMKCFMVREIGKICSIC